MIWTHRVHLDTKIFDVLEVDVEKLFDAFFSKLTDMQKFFMELKYP